jgi:hypothetical protein
MLTATGRRPNSGAIIDASLMSGPISQSPAARTGWLTVLGAVVSPRRLLPAVLSSIEHAPLNLAYAYGGPDVGF